MQAESIPVTVKIHNCGGILLFLKNGKAESNFSNFLTNIMI